MPYPVWSANIDRVTAVVSRMTQRHPELPGELIVLSRLLAGLGQDLAASTEELLCSHGINEGEMRVLMVLYSEPDGSAHAGDLVSGSAYSPANITRIADHLVARGLITRLPSTVDRRCVTLRITRRGEALVCALLPRISGRLRQTFGSFSPADVRRVTADLRRIAATLVGMATNPAAEESSSS